MATHTDDTDLTECQKDVVFAVDVLDHKRELFRTHVPFTELLADCQCGPLKCAQLQAWINKRRKAAGKDPLPAKSIKPATTIQEVIGHVC
jgi:hypothetical protein